MTNFDRTSRQEELPKLQGCFTRGTQYRWSIYETFFATLPQGARVLDVGCGSLVETHFMAKSGVKVTGIDLDAGKLAVFRERYDWTGLHPPDLRPMSLQDLASAGESFDAVTAFDVIEHLEDLEAGLRAIRAVLRPGGLVFITTPNGLSLSEIYGWLILRTGRLLGHHPPPGVPHLQMYTPWGWRRRFEAAGFTVQAWDMAIGPVANSMQVLATAPIQVALAGLQVTRVISRDTRHKLTHRLCGLLVGTWVPRLLKSVDDFIAPVAKPLFTWNLIILQALPEGGHSSDAR